MKNPIPTHRLICSLILGTVLLSGCSTVVKQSYEGDPATSDLKVASYSGSTIIYGSVAPEGDARRLVSDDFARLGTSKVSSDHLLKYDELQSEANDVGGDIVLVSARSPGTHQYLKPLILNDAGTPYTLAPYGHESTTGPAGPDYIAAEQMGTTNGQSYDYVITFWRKAPKS
jgi:hypothetical protein